MANLFKIKDIALEKNIKLEDIAKEIGITPTGLSKIIRENSTKTSTLEKIALKLKVPVSVFFDDKDARDNIVLNPAVLPEEINHIQPVVTEGVGVPYYDVDFVGGFDIVFNDQTMKPTCYVNHPDYNDCTCWVNLRGDSMWSGDNTSKSIPPDSYIALKYQPNWRDFTLLNENYAIVTNEFRTVKMLGKGSDDEHFNMKPINPFYDEQEIPKELILHMFRVKGYTKKFF